MYEAHVYFNNTDPRRRDALKHGKEFTLIADYTEDWHKLYVPRPGNVAALAMGEHIHPPASPTTGPADAHRVSVDALDLSDLRPLAGSDQSAPLDHARLFKEFTSMAPPVTASCWCGCCMSSYYSRLVDGLTLATTCHGKPRSTRASRQTSRKGVTSNTGSPKSGDAVSLVSEHSSEDEGLESLVGRQISKRSLKECRMLRFQLGLEQSPGDTVVLGPHVGQDVASIVANGDMFELRVDRGPDPLSPRDRVPRPLAKSRAATFCL